MKKSRWIATAILAGVISQSAMAQDIFFSNNLQDGTSVSNQFNINLASEGSFGFSSDNVITVLNPTNLTSTILRTNVTAGASIFATNSEDSDNVRSYLATKFGGYSTNGWKAHLSLESPTAGDPNQNYFFIGIGEGVPSGANNEPVSGDRAYVRWRHGSNAGYGRPRTYVNDSAIETSGTAANSIGADVFITHNADTGIITFEIDNWSNEGIADGVDITMNADASALNFSSDTEARIFFGSNATVTFSDFSVEEYIPTSPTAPLNLYAWPNSNDIATIWWDAEALSDLGYNVYRSLEAAANYAQIATGIMETSYVDSDVTNGVTYYYKAAGVNAFGEGNLSESDPARPTPYLIIGTDGTYGDNPYITKHQVFDGDIETYFDSSESGTSWTGLDFGAGNEQSIVEVRYTLRNWSSAKDRTIGAYIEASNDENFTTSVTLHTVTTNDLTYPTANIITVSDSTPYRYVRMHSNASRPLYGVAELEFLTDADFTANGTPKYWLAEYGLDEADDDIDSDSDGLLTWEEYVAGTIPTNASSLLAVNSLSSTTNGLVISWQSVEGKSYSIVTNTSLVNPAKGTAVSGITGLETETSYTGTVSGASAVFYEIGVE